MCEKIRGFRRKKEIINEKKAKSGEFREPRKNFFNLNVF